MKITDRIYLVGSGKHGMELSDSMDCNVYLIDGGNECALIDAGSGQDPIKIINNIINMGYDMKKIKYLLLTHIHGDHAAGAAYFHKTFGINLVMSKEARPWFEKGDMDKTSINQAISGGVYPENFNYPTCLVNYSVEEGDLFRVGDIELEVLNTPGHSRGHVSYLWKDGNNNNLFSGDVVFAGGKVVIQYIWDCNIDDYAKTMGKLSEINIDRLFPGHGPFLLSNASNHIEIAYDYFNRLEIPPNL